MFQIETAPDEPATLQRGTSFVAKGECETSGARGSFQFTFDDDGRFLLVIEGPLPERTGFDGREAWTTDWAGLPRMLSMGERGAEVFALQVWAGNRARTPSGWFIEGGFSEFEHDTEGHFVGMKRRGMEGVVTWRFADVQESNGRRFAHDAREDVDGELSRSFRVHSFDQASEVEPGIYQRPQAHPQDARFDDSIAANLSMIRARSGHVLTKASVDGGEPGWFILDTGAGGPPLIDSKLEATIDAPSLGSVPAVSVFGKIRMTVKRARSLTIGPLTLEHPFLLEQDLSFLAPIHDEPILGILGYDVLARCVVEIDLGQDLFLLHDPAKFENAFHDSSGSSEPIPWQRLHLPYRVPVVPGSYEGGRSGMFRVDVGAAGPGFGNVAFHSPAVEGNQLLRDRQVQEADLGGDPIAIGILEYFELGGCRFDHPTVVFAKGKAGPLSDGGTDGNIGVDFLKPFRLLLDYGNSRMAFVAKNCPPR